MNIEKFLKKYFKFREIKRSDNELYLTRYYVFRKTKYWQPSIYIHCFHSSDFDPELHNHGWNKSLSLILNGSYKETRRKDDMTVFDRVLKPGMLNYITKNTFHRVTLQTPKVWTLFISGSKPDPEWGFWNIETNMYLTWQEHEKIKQEKELEEYLVEIKQNIY